MIKKYSLEKEPETTVSLYNNLEFDLPLKSIIMKILYNLKDRSLFDPQ